MTCKESCCLQPGTIGTSRAQDEIGQASTNEEYHANFFSGMSWHGGSVRGKGRSGDRAKAAPAEERPVGARNLKGLTTIMKLACALQLQFCA
jgi:hypothetical protein